MNGYSVDISAQARRDSTAIYTWIADRSSACIAERFVRGLIEECESLKVAPRRGNISLRAGQDIRSFGYKRTVTVVFSVQGDIVRIIRLLYRGLDRTNARLQ